MNVSLRTSSGWILLNDPDADTLGGSSGAFYLARVNHTGTQLAATISDFTSAVQAIEWRSMTAPTADVSINSHKLTNVTNPGSAQDAATKDYVDTSVGNAIVGLWDYKGSTDASSNPNYPAASKGDTYKVSVAGKVGGASGEDVDVGDVYIATADNAGGTQAAVGTSWMVLEHNLKGALLAPNNLSDLTNLVTALTNLAGGAAPTGTGGLVRATSPTLITPALGTPSAIVLTNGTGLPITGLLTFTSAQLRTQLTDETGTGVAVFADSPALTGTPTVPTAPTSTNTTQAASTAFVTGAVGDAVTTIDGQLAVKLEASDLADIAFSGAAADLTDITTELKDFFDTSSSANFRAALLDSTGTDNNVFADSPALTGNPTAPTQTAGNNSTRLATTAFVVTALGSYQPLAANLTAIAGLTSAANTGLYFTGSGTAGTFSLTAGGRALGGVAGTTDTFPYFSASNVVTLGAITSFGRSLVDDADASAAQTTLGLVIGTNVQAYDAELAAIAGLTSAADKAPIFTGSGTATTYTVTSAARTVLDDTTVAAMLATMGGVDAAYANSVRRFNAVTWGAMDNTGATDITSAFATLRATVQAAGGGTIYFPSGTYKIDSRILFENANISGPINDAMSIIIEGDGMSMIGSTTHEPTGGTIFKFTDTTAGSASALMDIRGQGTTVFRDITFYNSSASSTTDFMLTTNAQLLVERCAFYGRTGVSGTSCNQDAIVFGGTSTSLDMSATSYFQGYTSSVVGCYFNRIRTCFRLQVYANDINIERNFVSPFCGGGSSDAALLIDPGSGGGSSRAARIHGNTFELTNYKYGVKLDNSATAHFIANNRFWDASAYSPTYAVKINNAAVSVIIEPNYLDGGVTLVDNSGGGTYFNIQGYTNLLYDVHCVGSFPLYVDADVAASGGIRFKYGTDYWREGLATADFYQLAREKSGGYNAAFDIQHVDVGNYSVVHLYAPASNGTTYLSSGNGYMYLVAGASKDVGLMGSNGTSTLIYQGSSDTFIANVPLFAPTASFGDDSTQVATTAFVQDAVAGAVSPVEALYKSTDDVNIATATTATLIGTGDGSLTLAANRLTVGKTVRIHAKGYYTTGSPASALTFLVKLGSTTVAASHAGTSLTPSSPVGTEREWEVNVDVTCRATGGSGNVFALGRLVWQIAANSLTAATWGGAMMSNGTVPADSVIDTTASQVIDLVLTNAGTGTSVTCNLFTAELLN